MKKNNKPEIETEYVCPACGGASFVEEGTANYKEEVTIKIRGETKVVLGGSPELDTLDSTLKCAKCGQEVG